MKDEKLEFLSAQYARKVEQADSATKLYFQSIVVLGAGVVAAITGLGSIADWKSTVAMVVFCGTPLFLVSWFGCFLFIYWDHHMIRVSLDYSERIASELLGIPLERTFLYHEDFLGVFNQAEFPPRMLKSPVRCKSVQVVFGAIGLPAALIYVLSGLKAAMLIAGKYGVPVSAVYLALLTILVVVLLLIHVHCVIRERALKVRLGLVSKWSTSGQRTGWSGRLVERYLADEPAGPGVGEAGAQGGGR
jgi:hypothetical protein